MYRAADTSEPRRSGLAAWNIVWAVMPWFTIATGLVLRALVSSRRGPGFAANTFVEWYSAHSVAGVAAVLAAAAMFLGAFVSAEETKLPRVLRWVAAAIVLGSIGEAAFWASRSSVDPDPQEARNAISVAWVMTGLMLSAWSVYVLRQAQTRERWVSMLVAGLGLIAAGVPAVHSRETRWTHAGVTVLTIAVLVSNADVDRVRTRWGAWVAAALGLFAVSRAVTFPNALVLRIVIVLALYFAWVCRPRTASLGASILGGFALLCLAESFALRSLADAASDIAIADTLFTVAVSHLEAFMLLLALAAFLARDVALTGARRVIGAAIAVLLGLAVQLFCVALAVLGARGMPRRYYTYPSDVDASQRNLTIAAIALTVLAIAWCVVFVRRRPSTV